MIRALCLVAAVSVGCASAGPGPANPAASAQRGSVDLDIEAPPTHGIAGFVRDVGNGHGIPFASLTIERTDRSNESEAMVDTTGSRGEFQVGLAPGRYHVIARYGDRTVAAADVVVLHGKLTRLNLDIDTRPGREPGRADEHHGSTATGSIAGQVVSLEDHTPFAGAVVSAVASGESQAIMAMTDDDGRFRIPALRPGSYTVTVYYQLIDRGAIELRRSGIEVRANEATTVGLDIDLRVQR